MFKVSRFRLIGYSSFADTDWIDLSPGFNLLVGQNNVGKSALISAFGTFPDNRHLTPAESRRERIPLPVFETDVHISGPTLEDAMLRHGGDHYFPVQMLASGAVNHENVEAFFGRSDLDFELTRRASSTVQTRRSPSHGLFTGPVNAAAVVGMQDGALRRRGQVGGQNDNLVEVGVATAWEENVFVFDAQRAIGRCSNTAAPRLTSNAGNLAAFLFRVQGQNVGVFRRIERHMQEIFTTVQGITVAPADQNNELEIRVWPTAEQELGFSLNDSGTGVAQVLAILTVALTMTEAVLVIDEISSHLHPAAAKTLVRILRTQYPQHQYLVSTHSAEIISTADPDRVLLVRKSGYDSSVTNVDLNNVQRIRDVAAELGVSLSDVFAAERIVWVEGHTEELCFPLAYGAAGEPLPRGLAFVPVVSTGELLGTRREQVLRIYRRLSEASSGLVPSVAFSFDREDLTDDQIADLTREGAGLVHFLPRRNIESYFISPDAIVALVHDKAPDLAECVGRNLVESKILELGSRPEFKAADVWTGNLKHDPWLAKVDGARLIRKVIAEVSDNRLEFAKGRDSAALLRHQLEHSPDRVSGLVDYCRSLG